MAHEVVPKITEVVLGFQIDGVEMSGRWDVVARLRDGSHKVRLESKWESKSEHHVDKFDAA